MAHTQAIPRGTLHSLQEALRNGVAYVLIASFVVAPVAPAFAQGTDGVSYSAAPTEAAVSQPAAPDPGDGLPLFMRQGSVVSPATPSEPLPSTNDVPAVSAESSQPSGNSPTDTSSVASPEGPATNDAPEVSEPAAMMSGSLDSQGAAAPGPGSVAASFFNQSQFKIDKNTGAARVTYPVAIPPGRNGFQPDLNLTYHSQDAQPGSIFGQGWSINIPYYRENE